MLMDETDCFRMIDRLAAVVELQGMDPFFALQLLEQFTGCGCIGRMSISDIHGKYTAGVFFSNRLIYEGVALGIIAQQDKLLVGKCLQDTGDPDELSFMAGIAG